MTTYPVSFPADKPLVTVTHPTPVVWVIEMHNGQDNRLTDVFINQAMHPALNAVEKHWRETWRWGQAQSRKEETTCHGSLIIVGGRKQDKFFSNGLDIANASRNPSFKTHFFPSVFNPLIRRLMTFPIPVVAAVNGHAFAGGMILAMGCDYRVMTDGSKRNAWLSMNEILFGAQLPLALIAVLRVKTPDGQTMRKITLEGHRFTPKEALEAGLVDQIVSGSTEDILASAQALAERVGAFAKTGAYGVNKQELYREAVEAMARSIQGVDVAADDAAAKARL